MSDMVINHQLFLSYESLETREKPKKTMFSASFSYFPILLTSGKVK